MLPEQTNTSIIPSPIGPQQRAVWLLCLLAAAVTALLLPRTHPFSYHYALDKPWLYDDLSAPFDFLTSEQSQAQTAETSTPYYLLNPEVLHQQKLQLSQLIQQQAKISKQDAEYDDFNANLGSYRSLATQMLETVFRKGILEKKPDHPGAMAVLGPQQVPITTTLTIKEAVDLLTDSLPYSDLRQPELLMPMLEKVLVPNLFYSDSLTLLNGKGGASVGFVKKGTSIIKKGETVNAATLVQLDSLKRTFEKDVPWLSYLGLFLIALVAFFTLFLWIALHEPKLFENRHTMALLVALIASVVLMVNLCHNVGQAIPLLLPIYLLPLMLHNRLNLNTAFAVWSVPVLLTGFALEWGELWICLQAAGAGTALVLNGWVQSWRDRLLALLAIFGIQSLVWWAALLADKTPETMRNSDTLVLLALAALLSMSRSLLVRFFNAARGR